MYISKVEITISLVSEMFLSEKRSLTLQTCPPCVGAAHQEMFPELYCFRLPQIPLLLDVKKGLMD